MLIVSILVVEAKLAELVSFGIEALIELIKEPRKGWHVYILFTVFSTNVNDGKIAIVIEDLKDCL
jgi:hypothetical protein